MRLFLSSYRAGTHSAELLEFIDGIKDVAFISNAKDYKTQAARDKSMKENFDFWQSLNINPTEIDLRPYFYKDSAEKLLKGFKFIWLGGGNTFLLRRALQYSGVDRFLKQKVSDNTVIYGGESAGAIITAQTLRGSEDVNSPDYEDDPNFAPKPYKQEVIWDGLGFLDFVPVPHYQSPAIWESIDGYIDYLNTHKTPYKTITENQVVIVDGDKVELLK